MAGLKESYSESGGAGRIEDGKEGDEEEVVVEKHAQECIESMIIMPHAHEVKAVHAVMTGLQGISSEDAGRLEGGEVNASLEDGKVDDQV